MIIDDVRVKMTAGKGGTGAVNFNNNKMELGPTGGSGGKGACIWAEGVSDLGALGQFRFKKEFHGEDGHDGREKILDGSDGKNLILKMPVGTVIHNLTTSESKEITKVGERILIAKGGRGGKGNFLFRSARNTSPKQFQKGFPGESFDMHLELKMIADVGFVGLPNVGKSSLLNELTNASAKVANYQFTTLEPNLGTYYDLILADIPGLIKGASEGKGLGIKFLKHIERTKVLLHFLSAESDDLLADYGTIHKELGAYNAELLEKPEHILISKTDLISPEDLDKKIKSLKKLKKEIIAISIHNWDSLEKIKKILNKIAEEK